MSGEKKRLGAHHAPENKAARATKNSAAPYAIIIF